MRKVIFLLVIIFSVSIVFSFDEIENDSTLELFEGKNNFSEYSFEPFYARDFVLDNLEVVSISYSVAGTSYGFLDVFGGIGTDFIVMPGIEYEIVARKNTTLYLR